MLELILGKDHTANTDEILRRVAEDVKQRRPGRIILVPELISHDMERRLCEAAGDTASRYAEVLSFTRLARRVSDSVGSAVPDCMDNGGRVVAMAAAARQLHGRLKVYANVETKPEFLLQMVDAVDEFKRCCISAEDLKDASRRSEGALSQKLEELSLLLEAYDALCSRGKRDPRDLMFWVLEQLEDSDFASERIFYIDGFPDLTRQNFAVLEHLIRFSAQLTVSLNCERVGSELMAFEKAGQTAADLVKAAQKAGVPVKITVVNGLASPLAKVREGLFQGTIRQDDRLNGILRVRSAESVYRECEAAALDVMELVQAGSRYRDISLVCTDMTSYGPIIELVFRRMGIPVYLSGTEDVVNKGPLVTVLAALETALDGFEQKAVLRYLRSVLSPLSPDICDLVENYAVVWGISGKAWLGEWQNHPDGLSGIWDDDSRARQQVTEQGRRLAMEPLERLSRRFRGSLKLQDQVKALYAFLEEIQFARRLDELAKELEDRGDGRSAQIQNQLWDILLDALEQLYDVLGQTGWDTDAFQRLFTLLLSQYDVGTIPAVLDAVAIGPVTAMRCQREKHLFVLGASEGSLPGYGGSQGLLTDQERVALRKLEVPLTGGALEGIQAEFAEVYGVFCGASESITVSCATAQPSYVYRRLRDMVGMESPMPDTAVMADGFDIASYLAKHNLNDLAVELGLGDDFARIRAGQSYELGRIRRENIDALYGKKLNLSASQVDRQAECRLSYFLKYGLRLRERKEAAVDPAEFGTYVHAVLENTARDVMAKGGFHQVSLEDTLDIAKTHSDSYVAEHFSGLDSGRMEYLFRRNVEELDLVVRELWEELSAAGFEPIRFELHFGNGGEMAPIGIPAKQIQAQLQGFVDRVDEYSVGEAKFFRVVDYKTGKKDFDYCDVFNGVGLQMLLYLFALEKNGQDILGAHPIPAGVQYFPARVPYVKTEGAAEDATEARRKEWVRKGLLLKDELSLQAMDPDMGRLSCSVDRSGELTGDIADREQMKLLRQYVFLVLSRMVDEIASGNVEPNPYTRGSSHDACRYCPYGDICHGDHVEGRRNYKAMKAQRFWDEIRREVNAGG